MPSFLRKRKLPMKTGCATDFNPELRLIVPVIYKLLGKWATCFVVWHDVNVLLLVCLLFLYSRFHSV